MRSRASLSKWRNYKSQSLRITFIIYDFVFFSNYGLLLILIFFCPLCSEIETLKKAVSSSPSSTLDSQNTSNPSCFASITNSSAPDPLSVVCFKYVVHGFMTIYHLVGNLWQPIMYGWHNHKKSFILFQKTVNSWHYCSLAERFILVLPSAWYR